MEIEEIGTKTKKLSKNKFFIFGLIATVVMAFIVIIKNKNTSYSSGDIDSISLTYPTQSDNESMNVESEIESEMTEVAYQNYILSQNIYDTIGQLQGVIEMTASNLSNEIGMSTDIMQSTVYDGFNSTNGYFENGMNDLKDKLDLMGADIDVSMTDLRNNIGINSQSILDRMEQQQMINNDNFNRLNDNIQMSHNGIRNEIVNQNNLLGNQMNVINDSINDMRKQNNLEHSLLSETMNGIADNMRNGG